MKKHINIVRQTGRELALLDGAEGLLHWDAATIMPPAATKQRGNQIAYLSGISHEKLTDKSFCDAVRYLRRPNIIKKLSKREQAVVNKLWEETVKFKDIPADLLLALDRERTAAGSAWKKARNANSYTDFAPHLKRLVALTKKEAKCVAPKLGVYDTILNDYDKGITCEFLDGMFLELRTELVDLLRWIKKTRTYKKQKNRLSGLRFPIHKQQLLIADLLEIMTIDKDRTAVGVTEHPFQQTMSFDDKRIAVAYREDDIKFMITSVTHEGGHALYELGMDRSLDNTCLHAAPSMGMHESQSKFWENHVCLSKEFWHHYYPKLQGLFPELKKIGTDEFYKSINMVNPGLVRICADEVTYCLHIIIRYEIEREMFDGKIKIEALPGVWNKKYREYLGVTPKSVAEGILQDVHWSEGMFGYFPSYALGNIYSSMLFRAMARDNKNYIKEIRRGNLANVREWLRKNIHRHGAMYDATTLINRVCKEPIHTSIYIDYLKDKFYSLYGD